MLERPRDLRQSNWTRLWVADETGSCFVDIGDHRADSIRNGDIIHVLRAAVRISEEKELAIVLGTMGAVERAGRFSMVFVETPNISRRNA